MIVTFFSAARSKVARRSPRAISRLMSKPPSPGCGLGRLSPTVDAQSQSVPSCAIEVPASWRNQRHLKCTDLMLSRRLAPVATGAVPGGSSLVVPRARVGPGVRLQQAAPAPLRGMCGRRVRVSVCPSGPRARPHWARMRKRSAVAPDPSRCRIAGSRLPAAGRSSAEFSGGGVGSGQRRS